MAIRSFLYAPGHLPDRLEEVFAHGADAVVYDLRGRRACGAEG